VLDEVERGASSNNRPFVRLRVRDSGSVAGVTLEVEERAIGPTNVVREFQPGDRVLLSYTRNPTAPTTPTSLSMCARPACSGWQGCSP
jgi:hypothetical protein